MAGKILKSILTVAILVLLTSLLVITGFLFQYFANVQQSQLRDELRLAANATEELGIGYLEKSFSDHYRLTWVAPDGAVLFDSHADADAMENHADREEIKEAMTTDAGSSSRYSSTLTEQTFYEAVRLEDGSVLRISVSSASAAALMLNMLYPIALIAILAIALSAWLARRMAKRVVEPLNQLNLENPMDNDAYEELSPLLNRIHAQHQEIQEQMRALQRNRENFNQIIGNMKEALVLLDHEGRIVSLNPAAGALLEIDPFCVGENFLAIHPRQEIRLAIRKAREQGHSQFRAKANGREYQFDLSCIESDGSIHGLVILAFDVTEQVDAERNRREFTANVSHELKTPLQSIIGSAELMENGIVKPEDMPRFVGHIRKEASRLVTLIEDIIRLSQLDEGGEMPREDVSLLALSEEVRDMLADAAKAKDVELTVSGDSGTVHGVRRLLFEMVYNLADNAIRYNTPGGTVHISVAGGPSVRLTVRDSGIGIPAEHQERVFERFYRVDKSHSRQSGGTGLGLSIVKHAAAYLGAAIDLRSKPGEGTAVTVVFPAAGPDR